MKNKVLHLIISSTYDGSTVVALRIIESMKGYDHQIVACYKGSAYEEIRKKGIYCNNLLQKFNVTLVSRLKKIFLFITFLLKNNFEIIHFHTGGLSLLLMAYFFRKRGKVIFHIHSGNISGDPNRSNLKKWQKFILSYLNERIIIITVAEHIIRRYQLQVGKTSKIYLVDNFANQTFRRKNKIINNTIGYLGRINSDKNADVFLNLVSHFENRDRDYSFLMKGDVYSNDLIDHQNKRKNLKYLAPSFDIQSFFDAIDILIFPSTKFEATPLVIIEAMANDTPIIAVKTIAVVEILGDYPLLIEKNDIEQYELIINRFYSGEFQREKLSEMHESISMKFSREKAIKELENIYNSSL
jgi:glycosyltransferase involved in cell wall biosynthesis